MRGRDVIGLVFVGVLLTLAVGGYIFYEIQKNNDSTSKVAPSTQSRENTPSSSRSQTQTGGSTQGLQVQGINDTPAEPQQATLIGPESFNQYEEHAQADSPLFTEVTIGNGAEARRGNNVAVLYKGWLTTGELFDQTVTNEEGLFVPFAFQLGAGQVIQGWDLGIAGMKEGGKRRLIIPSAFGYGEAGQGSIPPNAMLIFDVELVAVQPQTTP